MCLLSMDDGNPSPCGLAFIDRTESSIYMYIHIYVLIIFQLKILLRGPWKLSAMVNWYTMACASELTTASLFSVLQGQKSNVLSAMQHWDCCQKCLPTMRKLFHNRRGMLIIMERHEPYDFWSLSQKSTKQQKKKKHSQSYVRSNRVELCY